MSYRNGNYSAFYVKEPFEENNLGAKSTCDFCYYNTLRMWKGQDLSFPFNDSHDKNYNVRDNSDWEKTLKPRLRERLRNSKNIILFLSSITEESIALKEEICYGINELKLPVIVIYPEFKNKDDLVSNQGRKQIENLWGRLPVFKKSKLSIPVLHIPLKKETINLALKNTNFMFNTKIKAGDYFDEKI